jgi:hypothetical protein
MTQALRWALTQPVGSRAYLLAQAYTGGTKRVTVDGRTVEYTTMAEMERVMTALYEATSTAPRRRRAIGISFR